MEKYLYATGRRKTSVASVRVFKSKGVSTINSKPFETRVGLSDKMIDLVLRPLKLLKLENTTHFTSQVSGGGSISQMEAISHGISRALAKDNKEDAKLLRKAGLITRDPRMVERKKIGLKKARKGPQFSKR